MTGQKFRLTTVREELVTGSCKTKATFLQIAAPIDKLAVFASVENRTAGSRFQDCLHS